MLTTLLCVLALLAGSVCGYLLAAARTARLVARMSTDELQAFSKAVAARRPPPPN